MKKRLLRLASLILAVAMVLTTSSISSLADSLSEVSGNDIVSATENETVTAVSENDGEAKEDLTGNEEIVTPEVPLIDVSENEEDEEIADISENDEEEETEDVSGNEEKYDDVETVVTGKMAVTIGKKTVIYSDAGIVTYLSSSEFKEAENVVLTLKSNISTNKTLEISGKNITLDLGKYAISTTENITAVKVCGNTTSLTIKGSGKIASEQYGVSVVDKAKLEITSGTISGMEEGILVNGDGAVVYLKGGTVSAEDYGVMLYKGKFYFSKGTINANLGICMRDALEDVMAYISGGTINATGADPIGILVSSEKGKLIQTAGNVNVKGTSSAVGLIQDKGEIAVSGGNYKVAADNIAVGLMQGVLGSPSYVANADISGSVKFTVDAKVIVGMMLSGEDEKMSLKGGEFVLGSSAKNSVDREVYGIAIGNYYKGLTTSGGKITINSAAEKITGIYTNSLGPGASYFNKLDISIKATNAEEVTGVYAEWTYEGVILADAFSLRESYESSTGSSYNQIGFKDSTLNISGNIKTATGFEYKRGQSGRPGHGETKLGNDNVSISGSTISVTSDSKELYELCAVMIDNYNGLKDKGNNFVNKNIKVKVSDNKITVSAGKNAKSNDAQIKGVVLDRPYTDEVDIANNTIDLSSAAGIIDAGMDSVYVLYPYPVESEIKISANENIINVNGGKTSGLATALYSEASTDFNGKLNYEISKNTINVTSKQALGIYAEGEKLNLSKANYICVKGDDSIGVYVYGIDEVSLSGSQIRVISTGKDDTICKAYWGFGTTQTAIDNCILYAESASATGDNSFVVGAMPKASVDASTTRLDISNSTLTLNSKNAGNAPVISMATTNIVKQSKISSNAQGINVYSKGLSIKDSSISTQGKCIECGDLYLDGGVTLSSKNDKVVKDDVTVNAWSQGIKALDKDNSEVALKNLKDYSYIKIVDPMTVSVKVKINGLNGSELFSKDGELEAVLTVPEGYTVTGFMGGWSLVDANGETLGSSNNLILSGSESFLKMGVNRLSFSALVGVKDAEGKTYIRVVGITEEIIFNPQVTLDAREDDELLVYGAFSDSSYEKTVVVPYNSILAPADVPSANGYIFASWNVPGDALNYEGRIIKDTNAVASYVPDGFYVKDAGDTIVTNISADGKYILLNDEYYTGSAIKPVGYKFYYGLSEVTGAKLTYKNNTKWGDATITVKGDGKVFKGTANLKFTIKKSALGIDYDYQFVGMAYTGKKIDYTPVLANLDNSSVRPKKGTDFTVKYLYEDGASAKPVSEIKKEGTYQLVCTGKGGYEGERTVYLTVTNNIVKLNAQSITVADHEYINANTPYMPGYDTFAGKILVDGKPVAAGKLILEYRIAAKGEEFRSIAYINGIPSAKKAFSKIGTYEVRITGVNDRVSGFEGTIVKTYRITGTDISKCKMTLNQDVSKLVYDPGKNFTYEKFAVYKFTNKDGSVITTSNYSMDFYYGKKKVTDLTEPVAAGKLTIVVTGTGEYCGTIKQTVNVKKFNLADAYNMNAVSTKAGKVTVDAIPSQAYTPSGAMPNPGVNIGTGSGTVGVTYANLSYSYKNNKKVGTATVTIKGRGNCTGSIKTTFRIIPASLGNIAIVEAADRFASKKAGDFATTFSFNAGRYKLKAGTDYDKNVIYKDEKGNILDKKSKISAGQTIYATIKGKGNYVGTRTVSFTVLKTNIAQAKFKVKDKTISRTNAYVYAGDITATHKTFGDLTYGDDYYIVGYEKNDKAGTGYVILKGNGDYEGTVKVSFKIKAADISKVLK